MIKVTPAFRRRRNLFQGGSFRFTPYYLGGREPLFRQIKLIN